MSTHTPMNQAPCTRATPRPQPAHGQLLLAILLALLLPAGAGSVQAEPRWAQHERESHREHAGQRPMREAIGEVEQNYRGHVVDVQSLRRDSNEDVYRMRVLQRDGRVKTVTVPANERDQRQRR